MDNILSRFAEYSFWMARYMERAESLARILDVNETFARDREGAQDWLPIVQLHADQEKFFARYPEATADAVVRFYVNDRQNPNAIAYSIAAARENARGLRHLLSVEVWSQLNVLNHWLQALKPRELQLVNLSGLCQSIKEGCQLHTGIVEGTMYRDQVWLFYQLGRLIERADQTTRLVDIKYHRLLPRSADVGTAIDISQWNALLRSVAGYHGYRRVHNREMTPHTVAGFILFDTSFPRSVLTCSRRIVDIIETLGAEPGLSSRDHSRRTLYELLALTATPIDQAIEGGLHEFLDNIQLRLIRLTNEIGVAFFGHGPEPAGQSQFQMQ